MNPVRIDAKHFFTCWKALCHSERVFKEAILRGDFPNGASEDEFLAYLADIKESKDIIESMFGGKEPVEEIH